MRFLIMFAPALLSTSLLAHPANDLRMRALNAQIQADPDNGVLLMYRAREHIRHQEWDAAELDLKAATEQMGARFTSYDFGLLHSAKGSPELAENHFLSALKTQGSYSLTHLQLAKIYKAENEILPALHHYEAFIDSLQTPHPGDVAGAAELALAAGKKDIAERLVRKGIRKLGPVPQLLRLQGSISQVIPSANN